MRKSAFALALLTALTAIAARADDATSEIYDACGEKERIRLHDKMKGEEQDFIQVAFKDSLDAPLVFSRGWKLVNQGRLPEMKEIGEYLKARAYHKAGLVHPAYEMFMSYIARPLDISTPVVGRMAALECIMRIQGQYATLAFDGPSTQTLLSLLRRTEMTGRYKDLLARALVIRTKELVNSWDQKQVESIVYTSKDLGGYSTYMQALFLQRSGQYQKAIPLWEKLVEGGELPSALKDDYETMVMLYARNLFEAGKYDHSAEILRRIPRDSNYLAQALSDLSWALLQSGKKREAIGAAFNIQKSLLTRVYAPEAPLVASIAFHEMCQYSRALKNAVFFKKKYLPVLLWYRKLSPEQQQSPYGLLVNALRKKSGVPNVVLLEWLRSPEYRALQQEANLYYDEKRISFAAYNQRIVSEKGAVWVRDWKTPIPRFYNEIEKRQRHIGARMNGVLDFLTKRITRQIAKMNDNVQLLEIEIYDNAGEDMVWRNVNTDYNAWVDKQEPEKRPKDLYWEWGTIPVDPKIRSEVWEDELGWTLGNVADECDLKKRYREEKYGKGGEPQKKAEAAPAKPAGT